MKKEFPGGIPSLMENSYGSDKDNLKTKRRFHSDSKNCSAKMMVVVFAMLACLFMSTSLGGWVYATGNMPGREPANRLIVCKANNALPGLAGLTFKVTNRCYVQARCSGMDIPFSFNERMLQMLVMHQESILRCESIIVRGNKNATN